MQTVIGRMRIYQPAQKPATGKAMNHRMRNHTILQKMLPPPSPAPIFDLFRGKYLSLCATNWAGNVSKKWQSGEEFLVPQTGV
jgi:hypothetical protein